MRRAPTAASLCLITDASLTGLGWAKYASRTEALAAGRAGLLEAASLPLVDAHVSGDMTFLEACAVRDAVRACARDLRGNTVWVAVDNVALEFALRKGRSKAARVNAVVADTLLLCAAYDVQLYPLRVPSAQNKVADALSRLHESEAEARNARETLTVAGVRPYEWRVLTEPTPSPLYAATPWRPSWSRATAPRWQL